MIVKKKYVDVKKSLTKLSFVGRPGLGKVVWHNCGGLIAFGRGCDG